LIIVGGKILTQLWKITNATQGGYLRCIFPSINKQAKYERASQFIFLYWSTGLLCKGWFVFYWAEMIWGSRSANGVNGMAKKGKLKTREECYDGIEEISRDFNRLSLVTIG